MKNIINVDISDTLTPATLRVADASQYILNTNPTNNILEVTPPGYDCAVIFNLTEYFNLVLNANNLNIAPSNNNSVVFLPDGLYKIKYSIDPNLTNFVEKRW